MSYHFEFSDSPSVIEALELSIPPTARIVDGGERSGVTSIEYDRAGGGTVRATLGIDVTTRTDEFLFPVVCGKLHTCSIRVYSSDGTRLSNRQFHPNDWADMRAFVRNVTTAVAGKRLTGAHA